MNANEYSSMSKAMSQDASSEGREMDNPHRRVLALTHDLALSRALEELAAFGFGIVQLESLDALIEEVMRAGPAVVLLDAEILTRPVENVVDRLNVQFPDVRLIVAGHGADQASLATRIAQGSVFRFLHKPASAQRLKLFVDAAGRPLDAARTGQTQVVETLRDPALLRAAGVAEERPRGPGGLPPVALWGGAGALVLAGALALLFMGGSDAPEAPAAAAVPAAAAPVAPSPASPEVEKLIQAADQAFAAQKFVATDGTSAAELYQDALQAAPQDSRARSGYTRSVEFALRAAEIAFTENRLNDANALVVALQSVAPGNSRLAFLSTQLQRERERIAAEENRRLSAEARAEKLRDALREANERLRRGALLEPANDSAQSHYQTALDLAPNDPEVRALRTRLASRLLETAGQRLDSNEIPAARGMLDAAGNLGADPVALRNLRRRADELTAAAVARASVPVPAPAAAPPATVAPATAVTPAAQSPAPAASAPQTSPETAAPRDDEPYDTIRIYAPSELKIVRRQEVEYPSRAIRERLGGWVDVEFTITPEGAVRNIIVLRAEPRNVFENSAIQALRRWRYEPVKENGKAIEARTRMRLRIPAPTVE